jgi:hypothetical protein
LGANIKRRFSAEKRRDSLVAARNNAPRLRNDAGKTLRVFSDIRLAASDIQPYG